MASAGEETDDINLRYRQLRFNYYAVLGLMARVYLYAEDYTNALEYATKLLDDPQVDEWFPAVDPNSLLANSSNPDRVFSRGQLLDKVWSNQLDIEERTVDVHVLRLRKALKGQENLIRTVRGMGYMLSEKDKSE